VSQVRQNECSQQGHPCAKREKDWPAEPVDPSQSFSMHSSISFDSLTTEVVVLWLEADQGTYGWQWKGLEDWRVFWIGVSKSHLLEWFEEQGW